MIYNVSYNDKEINRQIDEAVYTLYGLTKQERRVVDEAFAWSSS